MTSPTDMQRRAMVKLPNHEYLPALNGCMDPPAMQWPPGKPYSPVVGTRVFADGVEWYVHENGFFSTTHMVHNSQLGRQMAVTVVDEMTVAGTEPTAVGTAGPQGAAPPGAIEKK